MKLAYVDACVWITLIEGLREYRTPVRSALEALALDDWSSCTSDAVRLEVLVGPLRRRQEGLIGVCRALLEASRDLEVPGSVFSDALAIADSEGLEAMDAVHVAIATHHRCGRFVSTDPHFRGLKLLTPQWIALDAG